MPRGKRGKKPALLEMSEDSSPLEEVDIHDDSIEEPEEATMDSHTMEEFFTSIFGANTEIDFSGTTGMDLEPPFDRAEPASAGIDFESDDESERELFETAGLTTTGLGSEEASGVAKAGSIGSYESLDDGDAKETTETAGLKTTGLEPEQLSGSTNRAEGAVGGWQEANPSTELQLARPFVAPRQIPVNAVIRRLRMKKEFNELTDDQLGEMVYQGLSHKKPILPSTDPTSETRVRGTYKVPKKISPKGTGKRRGSYKKKTADRELLKRDAHTTTANGGESISESSILGTLPRFKEIIRSVSQPQVESEDEVERNTVKKPEGEKKVIVWPVRYSRFLARSTTHRFLQFESRLSASRRQNVGRQLKIERRVSARRKRRSSARKRRRSSARRKRRSSARRKRRRNSARKRWRNSARRKRRNSARRKRRGSARKRRRNSARRRRILATTTVMVGSILFPSEIRKT
jgi:hypothetical protein